WLPRHVRMVQPSVGAVHTRGPRGEGPMSRKSRPGGGVIVTAAGVAGAAGFVIGSRHLLSRQAAKARAVIGKPLGEQALQADRVYKKRFGSEVDLLMLGDSIAAGLGADLPSHT